MDDYKEQADDGVKDLNNTTQEYYDELRKEELFETDVQGTEAQEDEQPKKTIFDHIRNGLIIAAYIIFFFGEFVKYGFALMAFAIVLFVIGAFFMAPIKKFFTEGDQCSLLFRASFFLRIILLVFLIISVTIIFLTKNCNLNYSYWIAVISFLTIATIEIIESNVWDYRSRKNHNLISRVFRMIFNLLLLLFWMNIVGMIIRNSIPDDGRVIAVHQLEAPYEITLIRNDNTSSSSLENIMHDTITITDPMFLEQFTNDLEDRDYRPMDIISELNYCKLERTVDEYYELYLFHNKKSNKNFFDFPDSTITLVKDKIVLRDHRNLMGRSIFQITVNDYYYLELSEETKDKLHSYIASIEK